VITLIHVKAGNYPRILCDSCGRPIEDASEGYVVWDWDLDGVGPVPNLKFIHKIVCDSRPRQPMSMSLEKYLRDLLSNVKYKADKFA